MPIKPHLRAERKTSMTSCAVIRVATFHEGDPARVFILQTCQITKATVCQSQISNVADQDARLCPLARSPLSAKDSREIWQPVL